MAKGVVPADAPKLAVEPHKGGPSTGASEIDDMVGGLLEGDAPPPPADDAPPPPADDAPPPPADDAPPPADDAPPPPADDLPFVPPQARTTKKDKPVADPPADPEPVGDDYEPPEAKGDTKAAHAWKSVKQERKALRAEVARLKAEREGRSDSVDATEAATLKAQVESLEQKLGEYDLASTSSFKSKFEVPLSQVAKRGANILVRAGKTPEEANAIIVGITDPSKSMDEIQELISDESIAVQGALVTAVSEFTELAERRNEALQHWADTRASLADAEARNAEVTLTKDVESSTEVALAAVIEEGNWMYAPGDNPEWNSQVADRVATAKGIIRSASQEDLVKYVLEGVAARPLRKMFEDTYKLAESRKAELDAAVGRQPGYRGPAGDPPPVKAPKKGEGREIADVVGDVFAGVESQRL